MTRISYDDICAWLREDDPDRLASLWERADTVRRETVGDAVHLRGLLEISNHCCRMCTYCGLRAGNRKLRRYRMDEGEIMSSVFNALMAGYGTVVLQAGEDYGIEGLWLADIVRRIKSETPLAVTLSMGERPQKDLVLWRDAGADRYLLRFETSDPVLYPLIHPSAPDRHQHRVDIVRQLKQIGYETGSGIMIGIPGQGYESLARDIHLFEALDLDMIGVGPYIPHPDTPMGRNELKKLPAAEQVPNTELMTYKVIALTRMVCPEANIPATTALATVNRTEGIKTGLRRGANIVMPNLTPVQYRSLYEIYPEKGCIEGPSGASGVIDPRSLYNLYQRLHDIGRTVGDGQGNRRRG
jgi:biotin synthase